jgi:iron complex outermembrane receptor protein
VPDATKKKQAGWRVDWGPAENGFTFQGDTYRAGKAPGVPEAPELSGTNVLARWTRQHADGSGWRLQGYYDHSRRDEPFTFRDEMEILDAEWQQTLAPSGSHRLIWGAGVREARDKTQVSVLVRFTPMEKRLRWANVFVQDEIALAEHLRLTLGAKAERNVYTGWEFLPSARVSWVPSSTQAGWAAVSRAVRAPARLDREFFFPGKGPFAINGGPDFQSEVANVLELGWRAQPTPALSYSATLFHHRYDKLRSGQPAPAVVQNMMEGHTSGLEAWAHWQATGNWRLTAGLSELRKHLRVKPGSADPTGPRAQGNDPRHQWLLRSSLNVGERHEVDLSVRHVAALPNPAIPAYTAVDVRWGWRVTPAVDLSLNLQNLFDRNHAEFTDANGSQARRGGWLKLVWRM